jgi:nucleotidyltransferase substrate binding protein (TIGR01987 family)
MPKEAETGHLDVSGLAPISLDLSSLRNATISLRQALEHSEDATLMDGLADTLRTVIRSGVIKHFELTYEPSWLFIKRWLETNVSPNTGDGVTRRELFRLGAENRLIDDVDRWMRYHQARNRTSHTYRETTANEVYAVIPAFLEDSQLLLAALEARND